MRRGLFVPAVLLLLTACTQEVGWFSSTTTTSTTTTTTTAATTTTVPPTTTTIPIDGSQVSWRRDLPCPLGILDYGSLRQVSAEGYWAGSLVVCARFVEFRHDADVVSGVFATDLTTDPIVVPLGPMDGTASIEQLNGSLLPIDPTAGHPRWAMAEPIDVPVADLVASLESGAHYGLWFRIVCDDPPHGPFDSLGGCQERRAHVINAVSVGNQPAAGDTDAWLILPSGILPVEDPADVHRPAYAWAEPTSTGRVFVDPPDLTWPPDQPCGRGMDPLVGWEPGVPAFAACARFESVSEASLDGITGLVVVLHLDLRPEPGASARPRVRLWVGPRAARVPVMFLQPGSEHTRRQAVITDISVDELLGRLISYHPVMLPLEQFFAVDEACTTELCDLHRAAGDHNQALFDAIHGDGAAPEGLLTAAVFILPGSPPP